MESPIESPAVLQLLRDLKASQEILAIQHSEMHQQLIQWMAQFGQKGHAESKTWESIGSHAISKMGSETTTRRSRKGTRDKVGTNSFLECGTKSQNVANANENKGSGQSPKSKESPDDFPTFKEKISDPPEPRRTTTFKSRKTRSFHGPSTKLQRTVTSNWFVSIFSLAILANAIIIGLEVDYRTSHQEPDQFFKMAQYFFFLVFTLELFLRVFAFKARFIYGRDASWNLFDASMVALSVLELLDTVLETSTTTNSGLARLFRIIRMARVVRIFRVLRFSPQLRIMLFMIVESVKSLVWLVCLLFSFIYMFSVVFTMGSIEYLGVPGTDDYHPYRKYANDIEENYGSVVKSVYTLFRSMTGGQSWGEVLDPLMDMEMSWFYVSVFFFFIVFSVLCFMNVVTGVFVDGALEKSRNDRDMVVEKQLSQKKAYIENLRGLFDDGDEDGSGTITKEEFENYMQDSRVQAYFDSLKVDTSDIGGLFELLDRDGSGDIAFDEFIDNLLHLTRAQSPEQYVQKLMNESRMTAKNLKRFMNFVGSRIQYLEGNVLKKAQLDEMELSIRSMLPDHMFPHATSHPSSPARSPLATPPWSSSGGHPTLYTPKIPKSPVSMVWF